MLLGELVTATVAYAKSDSTAEFGDMQRARVAVEDAIRSVRDDARVCRAALEQVAQEPGLSDTGRAAVKRGLDGAGGELRTMLILLDTYLRAPNDFMRVHLLELVAKLS
jgi:hypothetical protein